MIDLSSYTKQELFNKSYLGLASQDFQQCIKGSICRYIVETPQQDFRCAAGWLVSRDEACSFELIGGSWDVLVERKMVASKHKDFIVDLQRAHDKAAIVEGDTVDLRMRKVANQYGLTVPTLEETT